MATPLRYVIMGAGALTVACAELLNERGHRIIALVSPDERTRRWAQSHGVARARTLAGLAALIEDQSFDYLLSVVNFRKIPEAILQAPRFCAINYHDAPLPRYAGSHAVTWALLNAETRHAVTWHVMTGRVDAGDLLVQTSLDIDPDDTALTLNLKCHEAAVSGFRELLDAMEAGAVNPRRQDMSRRTFFPRDRCPSAGCVLPFEAPAERIEAMLRALDFGPHPNPLGLPKVALGESFALVTELEVLGRRSTLAPGSVVDIVEDGLVVATSTADVVIAGFLTLEGTPLSIDEVIQLGRLRPGAGLMLPADRAGRLAALCEALARHEPFWNAALAKARPIALPGASCAVSGTPRRVAHVDADVEGADEAVLIAFMALLARLTGRESVDIGMDDARLRADLGDLHTFFSTCLPLRVAAPGDGEFASFADGVRAQLARVRARRSHARDLPVRDPALRGRLETVVPAHWPVGVELHPLADVAPAVSLPGNRVLTLQLAAGTHRCRLLYAPDVLAPAFVEHFSRLVAEWSRALPEQLDLPLHAIPLPEIGAESHAFFAQRRACQ